MIDFNKITDIFCVVDEFCNDFDKTTEPYLLGKASKRPPVMSKSEVISICLLFHLSGFRCFKHFYMFYVQRHMKTEFPRTVSYNRFVELSASVLMPMTIFLKTCCLGTCTGISFVDSTPIRVCHNKRIKRNKVFKGIAALPDAVEAEIPKEWLRLVSELHLSEEDMRALDALDRTESSNRALERPWW